jgi:hypothetical protein
MNNMTERIIPSTAIVTPLIEMFNMCPDGPTVMSGKQAARKNLFKKALSKGYLIDTNCLNEYAEAFIDSIDMQYNSTFYKTWEDVTNRTRRELLFDQILHYVTTYGTDFSLEGTGYEYIPNTNPEEPAWTTYKVIKACTFEDLYNKCMSMICSGIALKSETVKVLTNYIIAYVNEPANKVVLDVDSIKNREALVILCDVLGVLPKDGSKLFAHIMYKATGQTMIIKNREMRKRIENSVAGWTRNSATEIIKHLNKEQMIALASVFNRYKELFLAFKHNDDLAPIINKIGRLSKKYHKPMVRGYWETILHKAPQEVNKTIHAEAAKATNFKLLQVMQSIRERLLLAAGQGDNMYIIRNGKTFIKENEYSAIDMRYFQWEEIYKVCEDQLVANLSKKACTVKLPSQYVLACPTSEKNFIGDVPMGTYCQLGANSVMGIYWRNDWGTRDFDLSFNDVNGGRIGWNSSYYSSDQKVIFSGDITDAPTGANEVLHFKKDIPSGIVNINRYHGKAGSKYKVFFGTTSLNDFNSRQMYGKYFMVDPNEIQLEATIAQGEAAQQMIGMIMDGKFFFYSLSTGYGAVTNSLVRLHQKKNDRNAYQNAAQEMTDILTRKANMMIPIESVLAKAGFTFVEEDAELDLTVLDRSTLIELFS